MYCGLAGFAVGVMHKIYPGPWTYKHTVSRYGGLTELWLASVVYFT